jgi:hypothetical protein
MSEMMKLNALPLSQIREYEEVTARMRKRDAHLTRQLRRMRFVVRILDLGFGFARHLPGLMQIFFCGLNGLHSPSVGTSRP